MLQYTRSKAIQAAVPAEPQVAIACLRNSENVRHARDPAKPMPIEEVEQISAQPDSTFPILKHATEV